MRGRGNKRGKEGRIPPPKKLLWQKLKGLEAVVNANLPAEL